MESTEYQDWYPTITCVNGDMCPSCPLINTYGCILKANKELTKFERADELAKYRLDLKRQLREKNIHYDRNEPTVVLEKKVRGVK